MGISFFGTAFSEPTLIRLASGYEAATHARAHNLPTFAATVPFDHVKGPLQRGEGDEDIHSGAAASRALPGAAAVQSAASVQGAAAAKPKTMSEKAKRVLHGL